MSELFPQNLLPYEASNYCSGINCFRRIVWELMGNFLEKFAWKKLSGGTQLLPLKLSWSNEKSPTSSGFLQWYQIPVLDTFKGTKKVLKDQNPYHSQKYFKPPLPASRDRKHSDLIQSAFSVYHRIGQDLQ